MIAVVLVVTTVVGFAAWRIWGPNPVRQSDRITRSFAQDSRKLVRSYRRSLRVVCDRATSDAAAVARAEAAIEEQNAAVLEDLEQLADETRERLEDMDGISLRTLRNRLSRVRGRLEEARTMIHEEASYARNELTRKTGTPHDHKSARPVASLPTPAL